MRRPSKLVLQRKKADGFTLIEVMIVVVIVAILMGAVAMSIPRDINDLMKEQANRFQAVVSLSQDEAIMQSRELALGFTESGYTFFEFNDSAWVVKSEGPFKAQKLPQNILSQLYLEGVSVSLDERVEVKPQVFILSSGEMTPFTYEFQLPEQDRRIKVTVNAIGDVEQEILDQ